MFIFHLDGKRIPHTYPSYDDDDDDDGFTHAYAL